ncbi:MAG: hypothetical protein WDW36_007606 [Sanguina aurantia]
MAGRVVPWSSWSEWLDVRQQLMSQHPADWSPGIDRVAAWRARGKVSLGVDITACLREAQQHDTRASAQAAQAAGSSPGPWEVAHTQPHTTTPPAGTTSRTSCTDPSQQQGNQRRRQQHSADLAMTEQMLRTSYSLPLVRMVNGVSDSQQRGKTASSVASLSSQAGLPRVLVDIRHSATHGELPSLPLLRLGARTALEWLRTCYWDSQEQQLRDARWQVAALMGALSTSCKAAAAKCRSTQGNMAAGGSSDEEEGSDGAPEGYTSAVGQLQRKQYLSELRSLIPAPWAQLLVPPLLHMGGMDPPGMGPAGVPDPWHADPGSTPVPGEVVAELAWANGMGHLIRHYPSLRLHLLHAAVLAMAHPCGPSAATRYSLWVARLLPCAVPRRSGSSAALDGVSGSNGSTATAAQQQQQQQQQQQGASKQSKKRKSRASSSSSSALDASQQVDPLLSLSPAQMEQLAQAGGSMPPARTSPGSGGGRPPPPPSPPPPPPPALALSAGHEQTATLPQLLHLLERARANLLHRTSAHPPAPAESGAPDPVTAAASAHSMGASSAPWCIVVSLLSAAVATAATTPKALAAASALARKQVAEAGVAVSTATVLADRSGVQPVLPPHGTSSLNGGEGERQLLTHGSPVTATATATTPSTAAAAAAAAPPVSALAAARALQAQLLQHLPLRAATAAPTPTLPASVAATAAAAPDAAAAAVAATTARADALPDSAPVGSTVSNCSTHHAAPVPTPAPLRLQSPADGTDRQERAGGHAGNAAVGVEGTRHATTSQGAACGTGLLRATGRPQWVLAAGWSVCAIGCLPSPMSVSGVVPCLHSP